MDSLIKIGTIIGILIIINMSIKLLMILITAIAWIWIEVKDYIEDKIFEKKHK